MSGWKWKEALRFVMNHREGREYRTPVRYLTSDTTIDNFFRWFALFTRPLLRVRKRSKRNRRRWSLVRLWTIITFICMVLSITRLFISSFVRRDSHWIFYLGDPIGHLPDSRSDLLWASMGVMGFANILNVTFIRSLNPLSIWPLASIRHRIGEEDDEEMATSSRLFLDRVLYLLTTVLWALFPFMVLLMPVCIIYLMICFWPLDMILSWGLFWLPITWIFALASITVVQSLLVLYVMTILALNEMNSRNQKLLRSLLDFNVQDMLLLTSLKDWLAKEHHLASRVESLNEDLWKQIIGIFYIGYTLSLDLLLYTLLFTESHILVTIPAVCVLIDTLACLVLLFGLGARLRSAMGRNYPLLNSLLVHRQAALPGKLSPLRWDCIKVIERLAARPATFSVFDLFSIDWSSCCTLAIAIALNFLLIISVLKKTNA